MVGLRWKDEMLQVPYSKGDAFHVLSLLYFALLDLCPPPLRPSWSFPFLSSSPFRDVRDAGHVRDVRDIEHFEEIGGVEDVVDVRQPA